MIHLFSCSFSLLSSQLTRAEYYCRAGSDYPALLNRSYRLSALLTILALSTYNHLYVTIVQTFDFSPGATAGHVCCLHSPRVRGAF